MHKLAKWEVCKKNTHKEKMNVKKTSYTFRNSWLKIGKPSVSSFIAVMSTLAKYLIITPVAIIPIIRKRGK